ncbi:hypothetical protein DND58_31130 [Pseudomonas syringae pv. pisi]|nr:hypothetical protein DND58_31130 [Pseudomonas syringae pv. pisi]
MHRTHGTFQPQIRKMSKRSFYKKKLFNDIQRSYSLSKKQNSMSCVFCLFQCFFHVLLWFFLPFGKRNLFFMGYQSQVRK